MSEIIIPDRLAARLAHDKTWDSCVTQFSKNIEPLLAKSPDFFPDYTIHGIDHINRVLDIADRLIDCDTLSEEPQKTDLLTPRDVAFLVCGIMLHDMGMFLRPDGVRKLVKMDGTDDAFGGKSWLDEWSNYVDRTKRLSQEKMRYHFGKVISVTEDCVDHTDTDDNKRIIGDFLRQHHARLAHEFAVGVLPGSDNTDLFENTGFDSEECNLIGLLARSHGMAIRDTEEYLKRTLGEGSSPDGIPVFYLMTVLRLADALEADEQRAPEKLEKQQKINVPISVEEWTWNQCIKSKSCTWRLAQKNRYIKAVPESSPQYVQLDKWLKGVQADLDLCWSILAEKYPYDRYRLSIHRVISNIHEPSIQETMNEKFLTKEAKITANPEIVKLMMEPLYGDDPTYGVRELLQNAVDACLEREKWEKDHGNPNYKGLVDIRIENGVFTITDNGMGMNEDVLLNYYLSAGSSYRSSDAWAAANTKDGKSQVARTGRFGVGFLAAFLLGDSIEVQTQHRIPQESKSQSLATDQQGYTFSFGQKSNLLDVRRIKRVNVHSPQANDPTGTTIRIHLRSDIAERLSANSSWCNWFVFDTPEIHYSINGHEFPHSFSLYRSPEKNTNWFSLDSETYSVFQWCPCYDPDMRRFYCNGIRVERALPNDLRNRGLNIFPPAVSIVDNNANLPLNLARDKLLDFPETETLYQELFRYYIAKLLLVRWDTSNCFYWNVKHGFKLRLDQYGSVPFLLSGYGYTLNYASFLSALGISGYNILYRNLDAAYDLCGSLTKEDIPVEFFYVHSSYILTFASDILKTGSFHHGKDVIGYSIQHSWDTLAVNKSVYAVSSKHWQKLLAQHEPFPLSSFICCHRSRKNALRPLFTVMEANHADFAIHIIPTKDRKFLCDNGNPDSLFVRTMTDMLIPYPDDPDHPDKNLWIPMDMAERRKKFPKAFEYIDRMGLEKVFTETCNMIPFAAETADLPPEDPDETADIVSTLPENTKQDLLEAINPLDATHSDSVF